MYSELSPFLTSLVVGLLIGIERERSHNSDGTKSIMGARTLPLVGLLGCLIAYADQAVLTLMASFFTVITVLINEFYWNSETNEINLSTTSAVATVIVFLLGYMAFSSSQLSVILGVLVFFSLAIKDRVHSFARTGISRKEMSAAMTFLISAFVILPLLPNDFVDPWGLIHPTRIWLLFVLIAGVQFFSYIALKTLGGHWGSLLSGFLGGFVSATATTLSFAIKSKNHPQNSSVFISAVILAEVSSLIIQILVLTIMISQISLKLMLILVTPAMIGVILATVIFLLSKNDKEPVQVDMKFENPISLKSTVSFALLISAGLVVIAIASRVIGDVGVYITSALGGLASMRVVTFSVAELVNTNELTTPVASASILIAMTTNMLIKLAIIKRAGAPKLLYASGVCFLVMLLSGGVVYITSI